VKNISPSDKIKLICFNAIIIVSSEFQIFHEMIGDVHLPPSFILLRKR
jgi:hypothetical protein